MLSYEYKNIFFDLNSANTPLKLVFIITVLIILVISLVILQMELECLYEKYKLINTCLGILTYKLPVV